MLTLVLFNIAHGCGEVEYAAGTFAALQSKQ